MVVRFFHAEKEKNKADRTEYGAPIEDPFPTLAIVDKAR